MKSVLALFFVVLLSSGRASATPRCSLEILAAAVNQAPLVVDDTLGAKLWEPVPGVLFLEFETQGAVTRTFLRMQEHFESPRFRGQVFSVNEFVRWYSAAQGGGHFTYFKDWAGFNFPSRILDPFYAGRFNPLTAREKRLLEILEPYRARPFYLVAGFREETAGGAPDLGTLRHETAHALFYLDPSYRAEVQSILAGVNTEAIRRYLISIGYDQSVLEDETHAYLVNDLDHLVRKAKIDRAAFQGTADRLTEAFERALARRLAISAH